MVRVISVHHFANQHIQTVEQPTASAVAPPHRLLLALASHCIEVRDLSDHAEVLFSFPTVDEVTQLVHCLHGDYIATVETKYNRQNRDTNFVRVYVNWDNVATMQQSKMTSSGISLGSSECGMVQPMRARIAGRVTPTTNQSELGSLEMIEIPVKRNPHRIQCCQVSGNIIIQANKTVTIYTFEVKIHDISKLKFIDFEEMQLCIDLCFFPTEMAICENYVACSNHSTFHLFKVVTKCREENATDDCEYNFNYIEDVPINYKKVIRDEALSRKEKITVRLPTIVKENSMIHKYCPFTFCDKEIKASVRSTSSIENKAHNVRIQNLIQLKLRPIVVECAQKRVTEEFKCMVLKPLYVTQNLNKNNKTDCNKLLRSSFRHLLHSVVCMVTTQQEGYLYQFYDYDVSQNVDNCISVYPFTAPIYKIVMEDYFLHALTETGLETYTLRTGHQLCRRLDVVDNVSVACPSVEESVCLVGLRPFLGVEEILLSDNYLVLMANGDGSPTHSVSSHGSSTASYWTLYNLELPSPKTVFNDISIVANVHRFTSSQTYCHLMNEAHMVLRLSLILNKWTTTENNVSLIIPKKGNNEDLIEAYRTSCALLGDHFIMCSNKDEYSLCIPYYKMALLYPSEVMSRVKKVQEQSLNRNVKGLLHYLECILLDSKHLPDAEKYNNSCSKQGFSETVIELFEKHSFDNLSNLVLKSNVLREYSTDKLINVLSNSSCITKHNEKLLALVVLHVQRCNLKKAQDFLVDIEKTELRRLLLENWELFFESTRSSKNKSSTTFSELTAVLMTSHPVDLSEMLVALMVDKRVVSLHKILKVFLDYLPASIGSDGSSASRVLQTTLDLYFRSYFTDNSDLAKHSYDRATYEAMKLLVRSYLSQLQIMQMKEKANLMDCSNKENLFESNDLEQPYFEEKNNKNSKDDYLFVNYRHDYLDKMPPFQQEITSTLYESRSVRISKEVCRRNDEIDVVLKKLQAMLCSPVIPKQVIVEVVTFLSLNENLRGNLSLLSIVTNTNEAVTDLVERCPQCVLQFGKDRFMKNDEWKFLIATLQSKIIRLSQDFDATLVCSFYKQVLNDVLTHVATSMNLDQLLDVFPQKVNFDNDNLNNSDNRTLDVDEDLKFANLSERNCDTMLNEIQSYDRYITICKETMHANQIKKLITATGQQLLCTLNL